MSLTDAINEITVENGGTPSGSRDLSSAIDALNDALAGSDQPKAQTIEQAVTLLGQHIGGGSSVTVEALTATENNTYTAPEGKAYSPVTVNVAASTQYPVINYDEETMTLDWTWQQVKDALDAGKTPLIPKIDSNLVQIVKRAIDDGHGEYSVNVIWSGGGSTQYFTDSADGFPTDY